VGLCRAADDSQEAAGMHNPRPVAGRRRFRSGPGRRAAAAMWLLGVKGGGRGLGGDLKREVAAGGDTAVALLIQRERQIYVPVDIG